MGTSEQETLTKAEATTFITEIEGAGIDAEAQAELVNVVSPTRLTGAALITRVEAMQKAGVTSKEQLIRTGYYKEGDDYGQANVDFFTAKIAATKAAGTKMTSVRTEVAIEDNNDDDVTIDFKEEVIGLQIGDFEHYLKAITYFIYDGGVTEKVSKCLEDFYNSIETKDRKEDALSKENVMTILHESLAEYIKENYEYQIENEHFDFGTFYWYIDKNEGESDSVNDWNAALIMMGFVEKHPEHPHLRKRFAEFMTNWTEAGIEHSVYLAFRSPVFDLIKDEHEVFSKLSFEYILPIDGNVIDNSLCDGETAEVLDEPQTIENLKQLGYIVKPRTAERIAEVKAHLAEVEAKEKAEREAIQKEYDSMPKAEKDLEDSFYEAIDNCNFDSIFSDAEKYKELIVENVQDIASNFDQYNPYCKNGREPGWLLTALEDAGAVFTDNEEVDTDENYGYKKEHAMSRRTYVLKQLLQSDKSGADEDSEQKLLAANAELILTDLIDIAIRGVTQRGAGTLVVDLINDSTTFMSGSDIEADIIAAETEGDEEVLKFLRDVLEEIDSNDWSKNVLVTLISNSRDRTFALEIHRGETNRQQLDALLLRLETKAKNLLEQAVWDEQQIELVATLRYTFTHVIGKDDQAIENYLSLGWGECGFTKDEQAKGIPFKADEWVPGFVPDGFSHDYTANLDDDRIEPYLPNDWLIVPRGEWHGSDYKVKPATGQMLIELINDYALNADEEELLAPDALENDRGICGQALVMTGFLTNQQNLQDDSDVVLKAFQSFSKALKKALDAS